MGADRDVRVRGPHPPQPGAAVRDIRPGEGRAGDGTGGEGAHSRERAVGRQRQRGRELRLVLRLGQKTLDPIFILLFKCRTRRRGREMLQINRRLRRGAPLPNGRLARAGDGGDGRGCGCGAGVLCSARAGRQGAQPLAGTSRRGQVKLDQQQAGESTGKDERPNRTGDTTHEGSSAANRFVYGADRFCEIRVIRGNSWQEKVYHSNSMKSSASATGPPKVAAASGTSWEVSFS